MRGHLCESFEVGNSFQKSPFTFTHVAFASRVNKKSNLKGQTQKITVSLDDGDDEGLALLIPDIQETSLLVQNATNVEALTVEEELKEVVPRPMAKSVEEKYMELMKALQFGKFAYIGIRKGNNYQSTKIVSYTPQMCSFGQFNY